MNHLVKHRASISFTVIDIDADISPDGATMGCAGDGHRNGSVEILDTTAR